MLHRRISKNDGKGKAKLKREQKRAKGLMTVLGINKLVDDDSVAEPVIRLVFGTPKGIRKDEIEGIIETLLIHSLPPFSLHPSLASSLPLPSQMF